MSEPGKRADGGIHTWSMCPDCKTAIRASRHAAEDCDSLFALRAELAAAQAKIARVEALCAKLESWCADAVLSVKTIRKALADPSPQEGEKPWDAGLDRSRDYDPQPPFVRTAGDDQC